MIKSKKGAEKILTIYWFAILIIVSFGIWAMAYAYYSHPLDVRQIEVEILTNKIADCISQKGQMSDKFFDGEGNFILNGNNLLDKCHLTFDVEDQFGWRDRHQYYINISFLYIDESEKFSRVIAGEHSIFEFCTGIKQEDERKLPKCLTKRLYVVDNKNEQILVEIFAGIRKSEKNVKL